MPLPQYKGAPVIDIEKLSRPFVSAPSLPTRVRPDEVTQPSESASSSSTEPGLVSLSWSARAGVNTTDLPSMGVLLSTGDDDFDQFELTRNTSTVRVENPDDSDQFVDVEVINSITFANKSKQKRTYTLNN